MAAYFVLHYTVTDAALYAEYSRDAGATVAPHGGELICFDVAAATIEGAPPGAQTVIIKFASVEQAQAWYDSAEYQAVLAKRIDSTRGFAVLAQSMNRGG